MVGLLLLPPSSLLGLCLPPGTDFLFAPTEEDDPELESSDLFFFFFFTLIQCNNRYRFLRA